MSSIRKTTNACKNGESEDCYFAGLKLVDLGHSYNLKKNVTKSYSRLMRTFNKESAITYYRLARQHYERDCKLDNYGGCSHIYYVTDVIGVLDPYADEDSYPRYIADAKKGDEQAIKLLNDAYLAMHEKMYQYGLVANPSKTQMDGYEKLSSMQAFMGPKIGEISKENTLAMMQILLVRTQETQDIDYSRGVTRLYRDSGFKYGNTEIDHFAQLVVEQAGYYFAETSRGYKNVMKGVEPLLVSPHENVRKEAAAFYKFAESEARRAPPPRDSFSAALAERLINNWTKPTDANTELAADTMAGGIALDLWLK